MIPYMDGVDGPQGAAHRVRKGPHSCCAAQWRNNMSAQKMTNLVDAIAMTLVNAALLAALPISAVLFVTNSI